MPAAVALDHEIDRANFARAAHEAGIGPEFDYFRHLVECTLTAAPNTAFEMNQKNRRGRMTRRTLRRPLRLSYPRPMQRTRVVLALLAFAAAGHALSQAPAYPSKLVRIINPVAPGGNQDVIARAYAEQMTRTLGQQVIVESRVGSAAVVGTRYVKAATPDGYTVLAISNTFARVPALQQDAGYDPLKDFAPISLTGDVPLVLVVNLALPAKNVKELIALAKRRPGELTAASSGVGSTGHVAAEMFSRQAGIKMLHVQYKGAAPAVVDLLGGHVMLRFDQVTTSLAHIRDGELPGIGRFDAQTLARLAERADDCGGGLTRVPGLHVQRFDGAGWHAASGDRPAA